MIKILITGVTGLFGLSFIEKNWKNDSFKVYGISRNAQKRKLYSSVSYLSEDVSNTKRIVAAVDKIKPDIIIHAASIGSVDYCQANKKEAWQTNVVGTRNIIRAAKSAKAVLIFLSTNAVYDGTKPPYGEKSQANPVDYYGKTKVISESDVTASGINWVIVRLMTMYGWHDKNQRPNPVTWVIRELKQKKKIHVVDDIYNNHLYVGQAVDCIMRIITLRKWNERYNIAGKDCVTRYQMALDVADVFSLDRNLIRPVPSDFFTTIAPRPKNTCFATAKMEKELHIKPLLIKRGLELMKKNKLPV